MNEAESNLGGVWSLRLRSVTGASVALGGSTVTMLRAWSLRLRSVTGTSVNLSDRQEKKTYINEIRYFSIAKD